MKVHFKEIAIYHAFESVFWDDQEGAGSPRSQATSRSPALLGLMN